MRRKIQNSLLTHFDAKADVFFPAIHYTADVVVATKRLAFAIECDPLSLLEARRRARAVASLGYHLIWILPRTQLEPQRRSLAERFMRKGSCYYSCGEAFFDHLSLAQSEYHYRLFPAELSTLQPFAPTPLLKKIKPYASHFCSGDIVDLLDKDPLFFSHIQSILMPNERRSLVDWFAKKLDKALERQCY